MKKLLFLSIMAVVATLTSFGQAVHVTYPQPISCTDDPLHPIAGRPYKYQAGSNQAGNYMFWATKATDFITTTGTTTTTNVASMLKTPTDLIAVNGNSYGVAGTDSIVQITWSDAVLSGTTATSPTFIAALKQGGCANNFNAWQLLPINAFTVDIRNLKNEAIADSLAYGATESQCFDMVRNATWNGTQMQYNFGTNVLYFEVVAANFTNYYTPTFTLTGLGNGQTAVIEWAYDKAFTNPVTVTSGTASGTNVTTTVPNTGIGVSIFVRVTISNNTFQGVTATPISLAVDGQNSVGLWDVVNASCTSTNAADQADVAQQTLEPRPQVNPVAPTPFVPGNQTN